ncbi:hypothetical protein BO221_21910 [Archangium sp. Cb G35]|uniref:hypothetical protein n=1 Tax=Archangium sp. Cb G35 TaxID=1920190 RepID=UPI00093759F7|nr:hypothetical protein [Archangium sp. Cb G35]OJT22440.1 hypothetical protein BO221_21910 [Archangium sp. Cb G35]
MATFTDLGILHHYFMQASIMRELVKACQKAGAPWLEVLDELPEKSEFRDQLVAMEFMRVISIWYAMLYVVIEGYRELKLVDGQLDSLLASKNVDQLRLYRNALFHFQKNYPESPKVFGVLNNEAFPDWAKRVHRAFDRFFSENFNQKLMELDPETLDDAEVDDGLRESWRIARALMLKVRARHTQGGPSGEER